MIIPDPQYSNLEDSDEYDDEYEYGDSEEFDQDLADAESGRAMERILDWQQAHLFRGD